MLDEQDPTNRDGKGLPFTVSLPPLRFMVSFWLRYDRFALSSSLIPRRRFAWPLLILLRVAVTLMKSSGLYPNSMIYWSWLILMNFSVVDCTYRHNFGYLLLTHNLALQLSDRQPITTPVNWNKGDAVIIHPTVTDDEATKRFPSHTRHLVMIEV